MAQGLVEFIIKGVEHLEVFIRYCFPLSGQAGVERFASHRVATCSKTSVSTAVRTKRDFSISLAMKGFTSAARFPGNMDFIQVKTGIF